MEDGDEYVAVDSREKATVFQTVMGYCAQDSHCQTIAFIAEASPREIDTHDKLNKIIEQMDKWDMLNDVVNAAEGKPELIRYGILSMVEQSLNLASTQPTVLETNNAAFTGHEAWAKAFQHLYRDVLQTDGDMADRIFDVHTVDTLKKGYAEYFYDETLKQLDNGQNYGMRAVIETLKPHLESGLMDNLSFLPNEKRGAILKQAEAATLNNLEALAHENLPPSLAGVYGKEVAYEGLFDYARAQFSAFLTDGPPLAEIDRNTGEAKLHAQAQEDERLLHAATLVFPTSQHTLAR